jgi:hypothetical protein
MPQIDCQCISTSFGAVHACIADCIQFRNTWAESTQFAGCGRCLTTSTPILDAFAVVAIETEIFW